MLTNGSWSARRLLNLKDPDKKVLDLVHVKSEFVMMSVHPNALSCHSFPFQCSYKHCSTFTPATYAMRAKGLRRVSDTLAMGTSI